MNPSPASTMLLVTALAASSLLSPSPVRAATAPSPASAQRLPPIPKPTSANRKILLQADQVIYDGNTKIVSAVGHVEIDDQNRMLLADQVTYEQVSDMVTAEGHVSMTDERGNVSFANHMVLADHMREGVMNGFGALIGKNGRLAAVSAQRFGGTTFIAKRSVYSPCKICDQPSRRRLYGK